MTNPPAPASTAAHEPALRILRRLLGGMERPPALRLGNQQEHALEDESGFTLILRDPSVLRRLVLSRDPVLLADAYIRGVIDIEGDLYSALGLKDHLEAVSLSWRDKAALLRDALMLRAPECDGATAGATIASRISRRFSHRHSRQTDRAAISFHYDVSNAFYGLWLDEQRVYSCAYFETPEDTLDEAQRNKLDHICRKLRLRPGERLLDIGCGWGALTCWAARAYGVHAHGITLSERQLEYARARICAEGLQDRVTVELRDYRDLPGEAIYDKVSSVGMFEHVGLANLPTYYGIVQRLLRPGGLFLNHGITHDQEGWKKTAATRFINRYVFPDGELDCVSNIQLGMERAGFEIHDVEGLRAHYALTLRHWVKRLEARREDALQEVDEATYRVWRLYMAACARAFEDGGTGVLRIPANVTAESGERDRVARSGPAQDWIVG
ncbi:MAG: cyclopropane-fatty-acyl-phospholipid synthase family protein [Burkholderiaceae bacterium]|nr:cyclopropane-fatty-acyl-phospholipid synthase family protein [Burkholderiaceae bacterium]